MEVEKRGQPEKMDVPGNPGNQKNRTYDNFGCAEELRKFENIMIPGKNEIYEKIGGTEELRKFENILNTEKAGHLRNSGVPRNPGKS